MMLEAPPLDEEAFEVWLDATDDSHRFGAAPRRKPQHQKEWRIVTHWAWAFAGVAFVGYVIFGLWMLYGADFAIGDALARASSARAIAHSRDQHLMAVGFYWMPLPAFAEVPFMAVFSRLGLPGLGLVMPTAFATSMTIPIVARIGRDLAVPRRGVVPFVVLFAINPYTVFCAGNGMSEAWQVLALAGCFAAYLRWSTHHRVRDLGRLGLWLAVAQMTRYESITLVIVFFALVAWQSRPGRRVATSMTVAAPAVFAVVAWTVTSFVITRHGFWKAIQDGSEKTRVAGFWLPDQRTLASVTEYSTKLSLRFAPGIVVAVVLAGFGRELFGQVLTPDDKPHLRAVAIVAVGGLFPAQIAFLLLEWASYGDPRYYMPLILMFTIAALVALSGAGHLAGRVLVLAVLGLAGCVSSFVVLGDPNISAITGEPAVVKALLGNKVPSGVQASDSRVDLGDWRAFTAEMDLRVQPGDVVVLDTAVAAAVHLFSSHPQQIATERDKDSERQLQLPDPGYNLAVVLPGNVGLINPSIQSMIRGTPPKGKRWVKVDVPVAPKWFRGTPELWQLIDSAGPTSARVGTTSPTVATTVTSARSTPSPTNPPTSAMPTADEQKDNQ